jgi:hypothetical protein
VLIDDSKASSQEIVNVWWRTFSISTCTYCAKLSVLVLSEMMVLECMLVCERERERHRWAWL